MAKLQALRNDEAGRNEPVNLGDRALDNLKFIRETIARSTQFTAVPGYGGILMGVTAVVAGVIAKQQPDLMNSMLTWLIEAALAFAIGLLAMWQKSKIAGESLLSAPAKKFAMSFAPPLIVGIVITLGMWKYGFFYQMPPICMLCYGAAVVSGGAYSVRVVPIMGWCFMAFGALAFVLPISWGNFMMSASFGGLHIIFGAIIARRYGG